MTSNLAGEPEDRPDYRTVFVQIDESFLQSEIPLTMQLQQWGDLLQRIAEEKPVLILVDYQFSPNRFEKMLPGAADHFESVVLTLSKRLPIIFGIAPAVDGRELRHLTLRAIEQSPELRRGCMSLDLDYDRVLRDFKRYPSDPCPTIAEESMAAVAAKALGVTPQREGLILTRGIESVHAIAASKLLESPTPSVSFKNTIVVIGSNFPSEDEMMSSHATQHGVIHPVIKGGLVHALNTEALLENRIAWDSHQELIHLLTLPVLLLFAWGRKKQSCIKWLWFAVPVLLLADLTAVNYFSIYIDAVMPALLALSCAFFLGAKRTLQEIMIKRQIQNLLGGLLSPAVFRHCLDDPEQFFKTKKYEDAAVLVLDIKEHTQTTKEDSVEQVFRDTNQLLSLCTTIVHDHRGCVERFRGDGLLAYFGAPLTYESALEDAISSAQKILAMLHQETQGTLVKFKGRVRIGISAGEIVLGKVGDLKRFDIAVTGLAANRAAHIESLADPVKWPIVVDERSLSLSTQPIEGIELSITHPKHPELRLIGLQAP